MRTLMMSVSLALLMSVAMPSSLRAEDDDAKSQATKLATATKGMTKVSGVWTVYHNDQKMLLHLKTTQLNKNFIVIPSIARGISQGMVLGGMSWNFGDDAVWAFRKTGDKLHVLRRNVRYKAKAGTPESDAVKIAYSDSVIYALPIISTSGGLLVDMTRIFMSDDLQIGNAIGPGFRFSPDRSTWAKVKGFPKNIELQVAAVYSGGSYVPTVSDPRGVQVNVHYSISELPSNGYKPRVADDRVGYFLTVLKDFSDDKADEHFVRYINRWNLQKLDPKAKLSPPKEPIIFYMEKTVPIRLRPYVQSGIEEWNKAFEKLGFANAIQVRQQMDDDTWDPEDIRYNTFRWITAEAGFAMGPSRVNPLTGQILDADIIFDSSFLKYWKDDYEMFTPEDAARVIGLSDPGKKPSFSQMFGHHHDHSKHCTLCQGMQHQMSFSAAVFAAEGKTDSDGKLPDEFIHQALKEVVMHEVGHTLGLRHNFKASAWKTLKELSEAPMDVATVGSVMDYTPANIAPPGEKQGLYYTQTLGPYDYNAIEYGYKQIEAKEEEELKKIASDIAQPGHDYLTDEDTRSVDSDPLSVRFDLGKDSLAYVERQMKTTSGLIPNIVERVVDDGEGYQRARQAFGILFSEYWRAAGFAARFPGGVSVHRDHKGDKDARTPFVVVDAAEQRKAMDLLAKTAFAAPNYDAKLLNHLAASRWDHWGTRSYTRLDYPIHDIVLQMQDEILSKLFSSIVLDRLHDSELKVAADADAYTVAEHLNRLADSLFSEWKGTDKPQQYTNRKPYISSFRRNLQRVALIRFVNLVTSTRGPEDARTLARMHLTNLDGQITTLLKNDKMKLDDYSKAHLMDSQIRIRQVLNAELQLQSVR